MNHNARQHTLWKCDLCDREVVDGQTMVEGMICETCMRKVVESEQARSSNAVRIDEVHVRHHASPS